MGRTPMPTKSQGGDAQQKRGNVVGGDAHPCPPNLRGGGRTPKPTKSQGGDAQQKQGRSRGGRTPEPTKSQGGGRPAKKTWRGETWKTWRGNAQQKT